MTLDAIDRQIIHILTIEPRASFRTIAAVTGISDQTAARRYRRLSETAGLRVLGAVDGSLLGWVEWFVRLQTTPGGADSIAEALARRPDTRWVHLASGGTEIICTLQARTEEQRDALFRDTQHLYEYLTGELAALPGVSSVQTAPIIRTLKRTGSVL